MFVGFRVLKVLAGFVFLEEKMSIYMCRLSAKKFSFAGTIPVNNLVLKKNVSKIKLKYYLNLLCDYYLQCDNRQLNTRPLGVSRLTTD